MTIDQADEVYSTEGPTCPNPDCRSQWAPDESHYYDESNYTEQFCSSCGETFDVEVYTSTSWTTIRRTPLT